jgi:hypothetical protein
VVYRMISYRYRDETTQEQIEEMHRLIELLDEAVGSDVTVMYGADRLPQNEDPRREAYLVVAESEDLLLNHYQPHPLHQEMLNRLDWLEDMVAADLHRG